MDILAVPPLDLTACAVCATSFNIGTIQFFVGSCAHVLCDACLFQNQARHSGLSARCAYCEQTSQFLPLSPSFEGLDDLIHCFRPLADLFDELRTSASFQFQNLVNRLNTAESKARKQKSVLVKLAHELKVAKNLKRRVEELEHENNQLKITLSRSGPSIDAFRVPASDKHSVPLRTEYMHAETRSAGSEQRNGSAGFAMSPLMASPKTDSMMPPLQAKARVPSRTNLVRPDLSKFAYKPAGPLSGRDGWSETSDRRPHYEDTNMAYDQVAPALEHRRDERYAPYPSESLRHSTHHGGRPASTRPVVDSDHRRYGADIQLNYPNQQRPRASTAFRPSTSARVDTVNRRGDTRSRMSWS